jgi:hypothetical protein
MGELSWVVEPAREEAASVLDGPIRLADHIHAQGSTLFDPISKKYISASKVAAKHWSRGITLKTLAIRVYLDELQRQGFEGIDERSLKRDLKEVEDWESTLPEDRRNWGVLVVTFGKPNIHLPVGEYSEGWKQRKRAKQAKK